MLGGFRRIMGVLSEFLRGIRQATLERSVSAIEGEYVELESAFLLMVLGPLVGVRTLTPLLSLELLEPLSAELRILEGRAFKGDDVLADIAASIGGEW